MSRIIITTTPSQMQGILAALSFLKTTPETQITVEEEAPVVSESGAAENVRLSLSEFMALARGERARYCLANGGLYEVMKNYGVGYSADAEKSWEQFQMEKQNENGS